MLPLTRQQIQHMEVPIGELLRHFVLPAFQRTKNEKHCADLYAAVRAYYVQHTDIVLTGCISCGSYQDDKKQEWVVFDGQHRLLVLQRLREEFPIDAITVRVDIYQVQNEEQMYHLYHIINQSEPVQLFRGLPAAACAPAVEAWFKKRFAAYWKDTKRPILINVNGADVLKRMDAVGHFLRPAAEVIAAMESLLAFYQAQPDETWRRWGIDMDHKKKTLVSKDSFYFGLYRAYEWIPRLFAGTDDHASVDVIRKRERDALPKKKKMEVWNKRFDGQMVGTCYCCQEQLSYQTGYHCGHKKAVAHGGSDDLNNLEVVCSTCNLDMGTMDMDTYESMFSKTAAMVV